MEEISLLKDILRFRLGDIEVAVVVGIIVGWIVVLSRCSRISNDWILWWLLCPSVVG